MPLPKISDLSRSILHWNARYPLDFWWRRKYNVPYGSEKHRAMTHFDMMFDYLETREVERWKKQRRDNDLQLDVASLGQDVIPGKEVVKLSKKDIDQEFDTLDLSQFAKPTVKDVSKGQQE